MYFSKNVDFSLASEVIVQPSKKHVQIAHFPQFYSTLHMGRGRSIPLMSFPLDLYVHRVGTVFHEPVPDQ